MSLHGKIEVNNLPIAWWYAKRVSGGTNPDDVNTYDVEVHSGSLDTVMQNWRSTIVHRYGDGAVVLAAKVLSAAVGRL